MPTVRQIPKPLGSCSCTWHWGIVKKTASLLVESLTIEDSMEVIRNYWVSYQLAKGGETDSSTPISSQMQDFLLDLHDAC